MHVLSNQLQQAYTKVEEFNEFLGREEQRRADKARDLKSLSEVQELQQAKAALERKLQ